MLISSDLMYTSTMRKSVVLLLIIVSVSIGVLIFDTYQFQQIPFEQKSLQTDLGTIHSTKISKRIMIFFGLLERDEVKEYQSDTLVSNQILIDLTSLPVEVIEIESPNGDTYDQDISQRFPLEIKGTYHLKFELIEGNIVYEYSFKLIQSYETQISLNNNGLFQGSLIKVVIDNVLPTDRIDVSSQFKPTRFYYSNYSTVFFMPMAYREAAKLYPLTLKVNEIEYSYELDVQTYAFKEIHFTVPVSTVNSTVGNQDAVIEYREVIYPTYETAVEDLYIVESFRIPVENARISSTFGEMRFVNNATTPTRHAGIDYAIECGTPVYASNAGYVEVSQFLTMIGNTIVIDHGLGLKTYYEHMESLEVEEDELVEKGQVIGYVGTTGYSTGCHLHFQAMIKNQSFNPEALYQLN